MPRFFLHVRIGDEMVLDPEGSELPDLEAARVEALEAAREMVAELILRGTPAAGREIVVCNEAGRELTAVRLRDFLR